VFTAEIKQK